MIKLFLTLLDTFKYNYIAPCGLQGTNHSTLPVSLLPQEEAGRSRKTCAGPGVIWVMARLVLEPGMGAQGPGARGQGIKLLY